MRGYLVTLQQVLARGQGRHAAGTFVIGLGRASCTRAGFQKASQTAVDPERKLDARHRDTNKRLPPSHLTAVSCRGGKGITGCQLAKQTKVLAGHDSVLLQRVGSRVVLN